MTGSILLAVLGWVAGWLLWGRPRRLAHRPGPARLDTAPPGPAPSPVTVVIPARDEAAVIGALLDDLVRAGDVVDRVIVVDDHSCDDTAAVAVRRGPLVEVVPAPPLPAGWAGKPWACHVGVQAAAQPCGEGDGDRVLVFLDADVRLAPGALEAVRDELRLRGGAVSVQPYHRTRRHDEQLSLFCGLVALGSLGAGRRGRPPSGLCGPLVATTLGDYGRAGGHASVRGEVIEDVALGRRYLDAGLPISVLLGGPLVAFRMYPAGLGQLVEGWSKNLASGAGAVPLVRTVLTTVWITALGSAAVDLATAAWGALGDAPARSELVAAALAYLAFVVQVAVLGARTGSFGIRTALCYPLPLAGFIALFLRSVWRTFVRRRVVWRGRTVPVGARARR